MNKILFSSGLIVLTIISFSCSFYKKEVTTGSPMAIDNVYAHPSYDFASLKNVLLLPLDNPLSDQYVSHHSNAMVNSLIRNFGKFTYFNVSYYKYCQFEPGELINLDTERLDRVKLGVLGEEYNAQAVLQVRVDQFQPFVPYSIKVKALLVDTQTSKTIWVCDHVFDTNDADVVNGMRLWWNTRMAGGDPSNRFEIKRLQPGFFLDYVFYSVAKSYGATRADIVQSIERLKKEDQKQKKKISKLQ